MDDSVKKLRAPNRENVDNIFKDVIGIEKISNTWGWGNVSTDAARKLLDKIIETRHEIAHKSWSKNPELSFATNFEYMKHLFNLATIIDYAVSRHLAMLSGKPFEQEIKVPYPKE